MFALCFEAPDHRVDFARPRSDIHLLRRPSGRRVLEIPICVALDVLGHESAGSMANRPTRIDRDELLEELGVGRVDRDG